MQVRVNRADRNALNVFKKLKKYPEPSIQHSKQVNKHMLTLVVSQVGELKTLLFIWELTQKLSFSSMHHPEWHSIIYQQVMVICGTPGFLREVWEPCRAMGRREVLASSFSFHIMTHCGLVCLNVTYVQLNCHKFNLKIMEPNNCSKIFLQRNHRF